jgi:SAM-dependent methyltransferase
LKFHYDYPSDRSKRSDGGAKKELSHQLLDLIECSVSVKLSRKMDYSTRKNHWETIYETKNPDEVSWAQAVPKTSLDFIHSFGLPKTAEIIDVGGGDSNLVDFLLDEGYENITVLDISEKALAKAKSRLVGKGAKVTWIAGDITAFKPAANYNIWHDRATFHFLTTVGQITTYLDIARTYCNGYMTIGTFSTDGPARCSGLDTKQYDEQTLTAVLQNGFNKLKCITEDHITPFHTKQNYLFCSFKRQFS